MQSLKNSDNLICNFRIEQPQAKSEEKSSSNIFKIFFIWTIFCHFLTHCILWPYGKVEINGILGYFWRSYSTKVGIVPIKSLCEVSRKSKREYFFLLMLIIDNYLYVFRNIHKNLNSFEPSYVRYVWDFLHCIEKFY